MTTRKIFTFLLLAFSIAGIKAGLAQEKTTNQPIYKTHITRDFDKFFAGCELSSLPDEIFELENLKELILYENKFTQSQMEKLTERFRKDLPK